MKWFWGDWFKCPEIRALSPSTRCAWFEMLGLMWESTERGYLTLNGKPYPIECLARCLGFAQANLEQSISEMESFNVFSRREDGAIYNRRMVADCELSAKRAKAGEIGGICSSKKQANTQAKFKQPLTSDSDSISDSSFLCFWKLYPRKDAKKDALRAWKKIKPSPELISIILDNVKKRTETDDWKKEDGKYIPLPASYLNGERWMDAAPKPPTPPEKVEFPHY